MKKLPLILLTVSLLLSGCSAGGERSAPAEKEDVLYSDASAWDFLPGYWTNGRSNYIQISAGDMLLRWDTNMPMYICELYRLSEGRLMGIYTDGDGVKNQVETLRFEKLDENTIKVRCTATGEESIFIRDSLEPEPGRIDNEYLFWSMQRAAPFLEGMWVDGKGDYLVLTQGEDGNIQWSSSLPLPQGSFADFCDGIFCAVTMDELGRRNFSAAYRFDVQGPDQMAITCYETGETGPFERISHRYDEAQLTNAVVFSCPEKALNYLEGRWQDENGQYMTFQNTDGGIDWNTNLPVEQYENYTFAGGGMVGISRDADGQESVSPVFTMNILEKDLLEVTDSQGQSYRLSRISD